MGQALFALLSTLGLRLCHQFPPYQKSRCFGPMCSPWRRSLLSWKLRVRILCCDLAAHRLLLIESILSSTLTRFHPHTCTKSLAEMPSTFRYLRPMLAPSPIAQVVVIVMTCRIIGCVSSELLFLLSCCFRRIETLLPPQTSHFLLIQPWFVLVSSKILLDLAILTLKLCADCKSLLQGEERYIQASSTSPQ